MARSDLLISLIRAGASGDKVAFRSTAEAIAAEERAKRHNDLAERVTRALNSSPQFFEASQVRTAGSQGNDFLLEICPQRRLDSLFLHENVLREASDLIEEQQRADLLRSHGLQPRHRILLSGPPGNGKTSLAEAIAEALAVPMFAVRYDVLIGSYLGETNQRLRRLFDYIRTIPSVLLFDEFDAIGKERGDIHETGEIKRVVSSLLLQMDALPSYVVTIAATNHSELLDRAAWRRFEMRLELPKPSVNELALYFLKAFAGWQGMPGLNPEDLVRRLGPISYSEANDFCLDVRRRYVLALGEARLSDILRERIELWSQRVEAPGYASGSDETPPKIKRPGAR